MADIQLRPQVVLPVGTTGISLSRDIGDTDVWLRSQPVTVQLGTSVFPVTYRINGSLFAGSVVGQGGYPASLPHIGLLLATAGGGGLSLTPVTGHLTFAGYIPSLTQPRSFTPTLGHLNFVGYVPTVVQPRSYTPTLGHLSFTGYVPTITQVAGMSPMPLPSLGLGASSIASVISPGVGHLTFTGYVPTQGNQTIVVEWDDVGADEGYRVKWGTSSGSYSWSADVATDVLTYTITSLTYGQTYYIRIYALVGGVEQDPSTEIRLTAGWCFLPTKGNLAFSGKVPTVSQTGGTTLTPTVGHLTFAGYTAGITQPRSYTPTLGHLNFTGYVPTVSQSFSLSPAKGALYLVGHDPTVYQTLTITPPTGKLYLVGKTPTVTQGGVTDPEVVFGAGVSTFPTRKGVSYRRPVFVATGGGRYSITYESGVAGNSPGAVSNSSYTITPPDGE